MAAALIKDVVLATDGVASLADLPPIAADGVLITNLFGNVEVEIYVNVFFGSNIPEVSWNIQERVKTALAEQKSIRPGHINIHIEGVDFSNVGKEQKTI